MGGKLRNEKQSEIEQRDLRALKISLNPVGKKKDICTFGLE